MNTEELLSHATEFTFYPQGADREDVNVLHHRITVTERSPGRWAVIHMFQCWDGKKWVHESNPSSRTDAFKKRARFSLEKAVEIALAKVDTAKVNGRTYSEWQEFFKTIKQHEQLLKEQEERNAKEPDSAEKELKN